MMKVNNSFSLVSGPCNKFIFTTVHDVCIRALLLLFVKIELCLHYVAIIEHRRKRYTSEITATGLC